MGQQTNCTSNCFDSLNRWLERSFRKKKKIIGMKNIGLKVYGKFIYFSKNKVQWKTSVTHEVIHAYMPSRCHKLIKTYYKILVDYQQVRIQIE